MRVHKKVLCVDDQRLILQALRINLSLGGYEALEAHNGRDALALMEAERPNLVILDVMLADMNGWDILSRIRENPDYAAVPVIMLTALGQQYNVEESLRRGANGHVTKPFEPSKLLELVRQLLGDEPPSPE